MFKCLIFYPYLGTVHSVTCQQKHLLITTQVTSWIMLNSTWGELFEQNVTFENLAFSVRSTNRVFCWTFHDFTSHFIWFLGCSLLIFIKNLKKFCSLSAMSLVKQSGLNAVKIIIKFTYSCRTGKKMYGIDIPSFQLRFLQQYLCVSNNGGIPSFVVILINRGTTIA
jgi:hypothetical protein